MGRSKLEGLSTLVILFSLFSLESTFAQKKRKSITTHLVAKWSNTPLLLEAAEFLASESPDYFWGYVGAVCELEGDSLRYRSQQDLHELALELAARYLTPSQLDILRFSLSLRTESPKLEMYRQVAKDRGVSALTDCPVVFDHHEKLSCQLPTLVASSKAPVTYASEHVYPGRNAAAPTVVLYAELGTPQFKQAHQQLVDLADSGKVVYVLRHKVPEGEGKVRLSGYGVELQIKSTEYKAQDDTKLVAEDGGGGEGGAEAGAEDQEDVQGFVFSRLKSLHPDRGDKLAEMKQYLLDMTNDMAPMKVWQLQDLSLQAAEMIMKSPPDERLSVMEDIASNFPSHARTLTRTAVSKELKKEVKRNSEHVYSQLNLQPSDAALFINGLHYDMDYTDIFTILDTLRQEERVLGGLGRLGLDHKQTGSLLSLDLGSKQQTYGVDIRDTAVHWINDIEKDKLYKTWPDSVQELLRPTFPGMLRSIRKNFFHVVVVCDAAAPASRPILKLVESFYIHRAPTRIGLVFKVPTDPARTGENDVNVALNNAFNYILENKEPYDALAFITDLFNQLEDETEALQLKDVQDAFMSSYGSDVNRLDIFGEDSDYDVGRTLAAEFIEKTGLETLPQVLMNGVPIEEKYLTPEDLEEQLLTLIMKETQILQKAVYRNQLTDSMDTLDHIMARENIMPRLNQRILSSAENQVLNMVGDQLPELKVSSFSQLDKRSMSATLIKHLKYLVGRDASKMSRLRAVSVWLVADLDTPAGRDMARAAVQHVKTTNQLRLGFIHSTTTSPGLISKAVAAALEYLEPAGSALLLAKILKEETALKLVAGTKRIQDYDIPGVDMHQFAEKMAAMDQTLFDIHSIYINKVLGLAPGERAVVTNGRIVGPLADQESLSPNDFELLEKLTMSQYGEKLVQAFHNHLDVNKPDISDIALVTGGLLTSRPASRSRQEVTFRSEEYSVVKLEPRYPDRPAFDLVAVVEPVSRGAQKVIPVLEVLRQVLNARIRVFLNCVEKHSEMPNKSYFRVVLEPRLEFSEGGVAVVGPRAAFHNIPEQPILTQNYHVPDNWLVEPVQSIYDLDNIKLESIETGVSSEWELGSLLVEGHCFESGTGNPPRGLQLTLGSQSNPNYTDTIVMANLGYLQLKADPGAWQLGLRAGRSNDIYEIVSHENTDSDKDSKDITVLVNSFQSRIVKLKAAKKPNMKHEELLPSDKGGDESGIWSSIKSTFSSSSSEQEEEEGLNIFCLATGHLYERLLKIMMLSVLKHTKTPVKFWILKNFLSPNLKDFIPEYARRYGFEYEYVQYKWPRWLNQQTEKQRTIWGYKILFLDVLFPLSLKKIIFVDTDQIVRTDLIELRDLDLGGAPYGYTPFCDSNKEMEGFRFWKQGYWRNHLAGRKYHISAIYVVDLVKFRQIAAGDRLRGQYQALSQDPNSLANLDQDLPNNMIHQVPIKSLPQEWLWCETWCSTDELKNAKSIDLCNNPLTKEPKLSAARRIVTEWTDYDEEMQRLGQDIAKAKAEERTLDKDKDRDRVVVTKDEL